MDNWRHIPNFNGYMINDLGYVLSFKNFNRYPNGYYLKHDHGYYVLSDNSNKRIRIHYSKLLELCNSVEDTQNQTQKGTYKGSRNLIRPLQKGKISISKFFKPQDIGK